MLIEFSVGNFRSFKDIQTLSFVAAPIKSKYPKLDSENVFPATEKINLLKSIGMYGANGSGKSNMVKALKSFLRIVNSNGDLNPQNRHQESFLLNSSTKNEASFFQIIFILDNKKYRYGFTIFGNSFLSEWLYAVDNKSEVNYFIRNQENFLSKKNFTEGKILEKSKIPNNSLVLHIGSIITQGVCHSIKEYFRDKYIISFGLEETTSQNTINNIKKKSKIGINLISLLNYADFGVKALLVGTSKVPKKINSKSNDADEEVFEKIEIPITIRRVFNSEGEEVDTKAFTIINHNSNESLGTVKFLNISSLVIDIIESGSVFFVDELDARFHPLLTKKIVQLFNSPKTNPNNAQLFFVTHDTNLLDPKLLRRDQIYFAEKNKKGESIIYSLTDFKGVRNDASFESDYIKGVYGAIPYLGDFDKLFEE